MYLFKLDNRLRKFCIDLIAKRFFESILIVVIIINCIVLTFDDNQPVTTTRGLWFNYADNMFNSIFTAELVVKTIALGVYRNGPLSYLRNYWNVMDFLIIMLANLKYINGLQDLSIVRSFRVLRPLRAIKTIEGMRVIVVSILASLPGLLDVLLMFTFILFIFGLVGMQLYSGKFQNRCYDLDTGILLPEDDLCSLNPSVGRQCSSKGSTSTGREAFCASSGLNPNFGVTSFDNIG
jgi:hypothetical protein